MQAAHHGGKTTRCTRGRGHAKQIEQRGGANGVFATHSLFHLLTPGVSAGWYGLSERHARRGRTRELAPYSRRA
jgi:hypothetical protein